MAKKTDDNYPLFIGGGVIVLALFFHSLYEDLLKAAILHQLGTLMGVTEAELVSRLAEMSLPIVGAIAVVWLLYKIIHTRLSREFGEQAAPRLKFSDPIVFEPIEFSHDGSFGGENTYVTVENTGNSILERCSVKVDAVTPPDSNRHEVQAALTTEARKTNSQVGRFFLSGGERKRIPLTALNIRRPGVLGDVIVETTSGQIRLTYPGAHLLEISANAEVGKPERRILKVDLDSDGRAKIEWKR